MCDDGNPDLAQLGNSAMMRRVANLLSRGRSRINDELRLAPGTAHQLSKHRLSHRRPTDITMADKQYFYQFESFLSYGWIVLGQRAFQCAYVYVHVPLM